MISIILSVLISLASKVFGALLIILRLLIKIIFLLFKGIIALIKNLIEKIKCKGDKKCTKK